MPPEHSLHPTATRRVTVYVDDVDSSADFDWMQPWFAKWDDRVRVETYATGGWEHCWDVEAAAVAMGEAEGLWAHDIAETMCLHSFILTLNTPMQRVATQ